MSVLINELKSMFEDYYFYLKDEFNDFILDLYN